MTVPEPAGKRPGRVKKTGRKLIALINLLINGLMLLIAAATLYFDRKKR